MNEKNAWTVLDNTADDIQEARDDNGCDDAEEEDDNEDEEHGEGPGMSQQECKTRWSSTHPMSDSLMTMSDNVTVPTIGPYGQAVPDCACQV